MSLPTWWGSSLPCGCVRGVKLCRDAEKLWDAVADAHNGVAHAFTHDTAIDLAVAQNRYEAELSSSYHADAVYWLRKAEQEAAAPTLFDLIETGAP